MKSGQGAEKGYESAFGRGLLRAGRGIAVAAVGIVVAARVALAAVAPGDGGLVDQMPKSVAEPSKAAAARALFADRGSFVRELTAPHARTHKRATTAQAGGNGAVVPPVKREAPVTPPAEQKPTPQAQPLR